MIQYPTNISNLSSDFEELAEKMMSKKSRSSLI